MTALFTGAGLSHAAPSGLPLAKTFQRGLAEACFTGASQVAPDVVDDGCLDAVANGPCNLVARLESLQAGRGQGALACMQAWVPNEAQLLAGLHLALGGLHVTVNFDAGVEHAYALLTGGTVPLQCREALDGWRSCVPRDPPALHLVSRPGDFPSADFTVRPLLVKLHGTVGAGPDGVVLPLAPRRHDDVEATELGRHRTAALDALADESFVLITGYSGADIACYGELVERLRPGRFSWVAPQIRPDVRADLRRIDPGQPVTGHAVAALRACLPVVPPDWPVDLPAGPEFDERFAAWATALDPRVAAAAFAWALHDVGLTGQGAALEERLGCDGPSPTRRPCRTGGLASLERHVAASSDPAVPRLVAERALARVERQLASTEDEPGGRRRARLRREAIELAAIVALLHRRPPPADALDRLRWLRRTYAHLADAVGLADTLGTQALVHLAAGDRSRALSSLREASRLRPASIGVVALVQELLAAAPPTAAANRRPTSVRHPDVLDRFNRGLPKVELHVHLEGSIAPSTLAALARRHGDHRVPWTEEGVRRWYRFTSHTDFLNAYVLVCDQLRRPEDFLTATTELGATLAAQSVRYAEVTVSPVAHVRRGIPPADLFAALEHGRREVEAAHGVRLRWCAAAGTRRGPAAGMETVEMVLDQRPATAHVVSLGLSGTESVFSRKGFAPAFDVARDGGLHCVVHAGEAAGAESIWQAIDDLGADRIGHGIRCLEDRALVARLRVDSIPLEVCPTSNVRTGVVPTLAQHPLPALLDAGLTVNVNTDDPAMFRTDLTSEYGHLVRRFRLEPVDIARAGVRAAFLSAQAQRTLLDEIDAYASPARASNDGEALRRSATRNLASSG